ncbi:nicotinate-nucleotide diphosphorylase (carboxylating) [Desulfolithobacter dissulfuricans]|uniref:Probable nicotinate-nucleotide pyrophosphorylase [carboxylating] n=1 Tax=Desulfolithobacter dissulfuricans TaxID=2795293 RepID=A0A915U4L9_9BACT|nr:carboxylating nicotinate-nucleotide diphosphorylase [Desulfolithobacter dissulfuricans]BCO07912.1 nicotinate-nucleotide diphosphorylase (carboxylating) [Desulfolithobacter dissulfuricans]
MDTFLLDRQLRRFIEEDLEHGDITTDAIFDNTATGLATFIARQDMVACGMEKVAARVLCLLGTGTLTFGQIARDGQAYGKGDVLMTVNGPVRALLRGERVALNLVQRLCGIATLTRQFVDRVTGTGAKITDTRKTTPGLRMLEKYAVRTGGGVNHRYSLADGVLIKDNHIAACGSIIEAVKRVRSNVPHTIRIEVETDTLDQVRECLDCRVDVIMLDNMDLETMREAVSLVNGAALVEASGGVTLETVRDIASTGVDLISVGALTHSAPACDIGLDWI